MWSVEWMNSDHICLEQEASASKRHRGPRFDAPVNPNHLQVSVSITDLLVRFVVLFSTTYWRPFFGGGKQCLFPLAIDYVSIGIVVLPNGLGLTNSPSLALLT